MGIRATVVFCVVSFLLGTLFTHWIADSLTLWKAPITDEHLWTAASYYASLSKATPFLGYFLVSVVATGAVAILWSFGDGQASNLMFDGGSVFLFASTVFLYSYSVIPLISAKFSSLPVHTLKDPVPGSLRTATLDLASNNLTCSVLLTGIVILQAGRLWTERSDESLAVAEALRQTASLKGAQSRARTPQPTKA